MHSMLVWVIGFKSASQNSRQQLLAFFVSKYSQMNRRVGFRRTYLKGGITEAPKIAKDYMLL